jgi:hypothetical protein
MTRWAEEDVLEEQRNNLRLTERRNKSSVLVDKSSTGQPVSLEPLTEL